MRRLVAGFLLALIAAGCGGSNESAPTTSVGQPSQSAAQQTVLQAGAKTQAAKSARISFRGKITGAASSGAISGEGAFAGRRGRLSMDLSDLGGGEVSGRMEMVFDGLLFYMKFPPEAAKGLPGGKAWVKFDLGKLGQQQGIDLAQIMQLSGTDPSQSLDLLRAASADFREVGEEEVRGADTTHYRGTVDLEKVAQQAPASARESYRRIIQESGQRLVPLDVWIDGEGLTRRVRFEERLPDGSRMELTQEYYDFGVSVDVSPPPDDEVVDITELLGDS
jgi:hypothetical protein